MILTVGNHDIPKGHLAAVVTTLDMTAPAMTQPLPFPDGIEARNERLTLDRFRALFRAIGSPWLWTSGLLFSDEELGAILNDPAVEFWIIYRGADAIGLIELDFRTAGTCELVLFGMLSSATGQGLGGPMMAHAQKQAFARDIGRFYLKTCSLDSPAALPFYRKAGFTPVKMVVEVSPDPRSLGALPTTAAPQVPYLP